MPADRLSSVDGAWRRSRRCVGQSHCVEVKVTDAGVAVRNSTSPGVVLTFDRAEWHDFVRGLKSGEMRRGR